MGYHGYCVCMTLTALLFVMALGLVVVHSEWSVSAHPSQTVLTDRLHSTPVGVNAV